jgi:HPt (histidine-containing phosphotransfer) domain-containing protein
MLKSYRTGARHLRAELFRAAVANDPSAAAAAAHRLKPNAHAIGAKRLGDLCALVESEDASRTAEELKQLIRTLEAEAVVVEAYLHSLDHPASGPKA